MIFLTNLIDTMKTWSSKNAHFIYAMITIVFPEPDITSQIKYDEIENV